MPNFPFPINRRPYWAAAACATLVLTAGCGGGASTGKPSGEDASSPAPEITQKELSGFAVYSRGDSPRLSFVDPADGSVKTTLGMESVSLPGYGSTGDAQQDLVFSPDFRRVVSTREGEEVEIYALDEETRTYGELVSTVPAPEATMGDSDPEYSQFRFSPDGETLWLARPFHDGTEEHEEGAVKLYSVDVKSGGEPAEQKELPLGARPVAPDYGRPYHAGNATYREDIRWTVTEDDRLHVLERRTRNVDGYMVQYFSDDEIIVPYGVSAEIGSSALSDFHMDRALDWDLQATRTPDGQWIAENHSEDNEVVAFQVSPEGEFSDVRSIMSAGDENVYRVYAASGNRAVASTGSLGSDTAFFAKKPTAEGEAVPLFGGEPPAELLEADTILGLYWPEPSPGRYVELS